MKKRTVEKYCESKELVLELSPQLNRSLGCMWTWVILYH